MSRAFCLEPIWLLEKLEQKRHSAVWRDIFIAKSTRNMSSSVRSDTKRPPISMPLPRSLDGLIGSRHKQAAPDGAFNQLQYSMSVSTENPKIFAEFLGSKNYTVFAKIGGARRNRIGFTFLNSIEKLPEKIGERDENEEQDRWVYHSPRRVRCVSVGSLCRA